MERLNNPIEENFKLFSNANNNHISKDLFNTTDKDVDLKTDLNIKEIGVVNNLNIIDNYLVEKYKIKTILSVITDKYMRIKFSEDRKSRAEFVQVNLKDDFERNLKRFNDVRTFLQDSK